MIQDGKNGFLTDKNPVQFAALIEKLSSDPEFLDRVGEEARNTLVRSWEDVVDEVCDRYDSLIKRYKG